MKITTQHKKYCFSFSFGFWISYCGMIYNGAVLQFQTQKKNQQQQANKQIKQNKQQKRARRRPN